MSHIIYTAQLPAWTRAQWHEDRILNDADEFKWSGENDPPAIGARVVVHSPSDFGAGVVQGYFVEHRWLGLMVKLDKTPERLKRSGEKPVHVFGLDLDQPTSK